VIGYTPGSVGDNICRQMLSHLRPRSPSSTRVCRRSSFSTSRADPNNHSNASMGGAQDNGTLLFEQGGRRRRNAVFRRLRDRRRDLGERIPSDQSRHPVRELPKSIFLHELPPRQRGIGVWVWTSAPIVFSGERGSASELFTGRQFMTTDPVHPTRSSQAMRTSGARSTTAATRLSWKRMHRFSGLFPGQFQPELRRLDRARSVAERRCLRLWRRSQRRSCGGSTAHGRRWPETLWVATNLGRVFVSHNARQCDAGQRDVRGASIRPTRRRLNAS